jgi:hypothetical protein
VDTKRFSVHDYELVGFAERQVGWARMIYEFGNGYIHLSSQHDPGQDAFQRLPLSKRRETAKYLFDEWGGTASPNSTFEEIVAYMPKVLKKVSDNVGVNLKWLERSSAV